MMVHFLMTIDSHMYANVGNPAMVEGLLSHIAYVENKVGSYDSWSLVCGV